MEQQFSIVHLGTRVKGERKSTTVPALGKVKGNIGGTEITLFHREFCRILFPAPLTSAWREMPPFWRQQELLSGQQGYAFPCCWCFKGI